MTPAADIARAAARHALRTIPGTPHATVVMMESLADSCADAVLAALPLILGMADDARVDAESLAAELNAIKDALREAFTTDDVGDIARAVRFTEQQWMDTLAERDAANARADQAIRFAAQVEEECARKDAGLERVLALLGSCWHFDDPTEVARDCRSALSDRRRWCASCHARAALAPVHDLPSDTETGA